MALVIEDNAYWFSPDTFRVLNETMTDVSVRLVDDMTFEE
jgi:hypothetical protein